MNDGAAPDHVLRFGPYELDPERRTLERDGEPVRVGSRAFDLLHTLALAHPAPISGDALLRAVWGDGAVDRNNLRVQIAGLRKLLGATAIRHDAVRGYWLDWPVQRPDDEAAAVAGSTAGNLPEHGIALTAREDELAALDRRLRERGARVTLTGGPGIGKTTLAVAAAQKLRGHHADGVWLVDLSAVVGGADVCATAAAALGLHAGAAASPQRFARALSERPVLLVLDNCEHVRDAAQALCDALLRDAPAVAVLATSRRELKCAGEHALQLRPLSLPDDDSLAAARASHAVALFEERARRADPRFAVTAGNAAAVCRIGRLLDGVPLAINFAAARVALWGVEALSQRLGDPAGPLGLPVAGQAPRHRTPAETIRWSYELLGAPGQDLMAVLGAFAGTVPLGALQRVAAEAGVDAGAVLQGVAELLENSLLVTDAATLVGEGDRVRKPGAAEPRYAMHALVRDFAHQLLAARADAAALHRAHALWCRTLIADSDAGVKRRPRAEMPPQSDVDNLRKAIRWASDHDVPLAMDLCARMAPFWRARGMYLEGLGLSMPLLDRPQPAGTALQRARLQSRMCGLLFETEQLDRLMSTAQAALAEATAAANDCEATAALAWVGIAHHALGSTEMAIAALKDSLRHARLGDDTVQEGVTLANLALMLIAERRIAEARDLLVTAMEIGRRIDDPFVVAVGHESLGEMALVDGQLADAVAHGRAAMAAYRRLDMKYRVANATQLVVLGLLGDGVLDRACDSVLEVLRAAARHGFERLIAEGMVCLAGIHLARGQSQRARALLLAGDQRLEAAAISLSGHMRDQAARWRQRLEHTSVEPVLPPPSVGTAMQWAAELALLLARDPAVRDARAADVQG